MSAESAKALELAEEEKLKQKYPNLGRKGAGNSLLQKRLNKGAHKYFDSGDYNMARARASNQQQQQGASAVHPADHDAAALPDAPLEAATAAAIVAAADVADSALLQEVTGDTIPTPDNIPAMRKRSLTGSLEHHQHQVTHPEHCETGQGVPDTQLPTFTA